MLRLVKDTAVKDLVIDSRKALVSPASVFFAIGGERHDGHDFIADLYASGIRQFIVERKIPLSDFPEANVLLVASATEALQAIAAHHRSSFTIPVIAITGSNGKTIIKEWLYQLLSPSLRVIKNPGSYNSQLGVPLSVWQLNPDHELGIFEAGISKPGEMARLEKVIQPSLGIFTNVGTAHDEGFSGREEKIKEKLTLFGHVSTLIYCADHKEIDKAIKQSGIPAISWGFQPGADYHIAQAEHKHLVKRNGIQFEVIFPFSDSASIENGLHAVMVMVQLNIAPAVIQERMNSLRSIAMRLELKQGINDCQIIDDSYNNDLGGLKISLDFLKSFQKKRKTLILSDILQSGMDYSLLTRQVADMIRGASIHRLIVIGSLLSQHKQALTEAAPLVTFYDSTSAALGHLDWNEFVHEIILIKGARIFQFEKIVARLQRKIHGTRMEIDLNKIVANLNFFKSRLKSDTKIMVMVKAFAYGSGSEEVANLLQYHRVDYLGVAYADEGIDLRKNQIALPIMVMNATPESFAGVLENRLEPVMYDLAMLHAWIDFAKGRPCSIHLELETGMKRLGLEEEDLDSTISLLKRNPNISIASVFSHLAAADENAHDDFSKEQVKRYEDSYQKISSALGVKPLRHILNSPGILRLPQFQMDMVRLGIGLYGVNPTAETFDKLQPVATLKTVISQIKKIKRGESIGYGRKGKAEQEMTLATIAIGYADGFSRSFSRGAGKVVVNNRPAPVVGNVCMDMTMVDITGIEAKEGDDVIIFGDQLPIHEVAASINTIPYEILTNTSERVKRVFFAEGI